MEKYYNLYSILLGLLGWSVPCLILLRRWKWRKECAHVLSLSACALSLYFQILEAESRIYIGDFSALLDTWDVVADIALFLWGTTVILNLWAIKKQKN